MQRVKGDVSTVGDVESVWPRLQASHEKPHWISVDFSHWEYQDESSEEEEEEGRGRGEVNPETIKKMVRGREGRGRKGREGKKEREGGKGGKRGREG